MPYQFLPPLSEEDYSALKKDIEARGVLVPVEYDQDGEVLDGHHRVRICKELGLTDWPRITRTFATEADKRTHARQLNIARRHLKQEQRRALIADELKEQPAKSNRQVAKSLGVSHHTVAEVRDNLEAGGQIAHVTQASGADGKIYPIHQNKAGVERDAYRLLRGTFFDNDVYIGALKELPPEQQREKVERDLAAAEKRANRRKRREVVVAPVLEHLADEDVEERQFAALMGAWNKASPAVRQRFREEIDTPVMDVAANVLARRMQ